MKRAMAVFLLLQTLYIFLSENTSYSGGVNMLLILLLTLIVGTLTGLLYATVTRIRKAEALKNASLSYAADLAGSALGAMIVSVFCLPLLGMYITGVSLAGFCLVIIILIRFRRGARSVSGL